MPDRHATKRFWPLALAALALALVTPACDKAVLPIPGPTVTSRPADTSTPAFGRVEAEVVEVVDGDTINVAIGGTVYAVRYIGIDCPETTHPYEPVEWMGPEATEANRQLVEDRIVYLEKDVSETDRYGRSLRYVFLADGTFVNAELVRLGYAQSVTYAPDVRHQNLLLKMQQEAMEAERGLWGAAPPAPTGILIRIVTVDKSAEFVDIRNDGDQAQDLGGWVLVSEKGDQRCALGGVLNPGDTLRVWAQAEDAGQGGYNCGSVDHVWSNDAPDPAALYDNAGQLVARYP